MDFLSAVILAAIYILWKRNKSIWFPVGCPVYLTKEEVYDKFEPLSQKEKDIILSAMFYTVNWFIEVTLVNKLIWLFVE